MTDPVHPERDAAARVAGERARDLGMANALRGAPSDWLAACEQAICYVAVRRSEMTTDPVWTVLESWGVPPPPEPRALGPLMRAAVSAGWLENAGRTHKSVRPACHRRDLRVYRSHIYTPGVA